MSSVVNIQTGASGYRESIVSQAKAAQAVVNKMQMAPTLNSSGLVQPLGRITNSASEFQKSMDASAARVFAFGAAVGVINGVSDAFRSMIEATAEVEKSLKDIQVVMEATDEAMKSFGDGLFDVARNTATSFDLVAASATELARQGLSSEETLARVNSALILSRLSGLDTVKSTETLTAAINSFNKEGISHEEVVNRMANVDAAFAVSSADLAEAISRAGAVAQSAGVSFNELSAIVTAVQQRTARGGSVIGNGFKSIFTRIKRSGVREALEEIGVATTKNDGSFRSSIAILKDYAQVYKGLSDAQKASTSEQIAGVFQIQNLQALIQDLSGDYSVYEKALSVANNTTDQAIQRNDALNQTLSAMFSQTSLSAKELAASIGELAFSDSFKEILTFLNSLAQKFNELLSDDKGSDLAKNLVKGIGSFLTGPGLVILGAAFLKIFGLVTKFAKEAFSDLLGMNKEAKRQQSLQAAIGQILSSNAGIYQKILAAGTNTAKQEQIILNIIKQETAERLKQEALIKRMSASTALIGIGANESGFVPMGKRSSRKKGSKTLNMASGFLPSFNKEQSDIRNGVGGARRGDRPVMLRNHKMGPGKTQDIVAHTGEWVVKNFEGSGGTAIFNRNMVKQVGLPKGAKKITASGGLIPNFNKLQEQTHTFSSFQLGGTKGGQGPISRLSDMADQFTGKVKVEKMDLNNKYFSSNASKIVKGDKTKDIPGLITADKEAKEKGFTKYKVNNQAVKMFKTRYGRLVKSGPYKGIIKTAQNIEKNPLNNYKTADGQPKEISDLYKGLMGKLKGAEGEFQSKIFLEKKGYGNVEYVPKAGSFDLTATEKNRSKEKFFETKATQNQNVVVGLKKAADQYLNTLAQTQKSQGKPGVGIKNNKKDRINLTSGNAMFAGGINLLTASDTKLSKSKITATQKSENFSTTDTFRMLRSYIDDDYRKKQAKYKFIDKNILAQNLNKKIDQIENIKELEYYNKYITRGMNNVQIRSMSLDELKQSREEIVNRISVAKSPEKSNMLFADPNYNKIPNYSSGFIPNFMIKQSGFGRSGSVYSMNIGKEKILNVSHIRAEEGEFGSSIYKKIIKEIETAALSGEPYTKIDTGSIIGPRIPRALLAAKKLLDKKRGSVKIPKMKLEGVFVPKQLRKRVESFRQDNYHSEFGKFKTRDRAEYLPGEERKLIKSLRAFGLGRNAHKRKKFVRLEDLPIGKSFSQGFVPNFRNVNLYRGQKRSELDLPNIGKNMPNFNQAKTPEDLVAIIQKFVKSHSTGPLSGYRNMGEIDGKMPSGATSFSTSKKVAENFADSINVGKPVVPGKIFQKTVPEKNIFSKKKLLKIFNKGANPDQNFYPKVDQFKIAMNAGTVEKWAKKNGGIFLNIAGEYNDKRHLNLAKMDAGRMRSKYGKDMPSIVPEIDVGRTLAGKRDIFRKEKEVMHVMSRGYIPNFSFRGGALKRIATKMHKPAIEDPKGKILYQGKKYREAKFNTPDWDNPNVKWISPVAQRIQGGKQEVEEFAKYLSTRKDIPAYVASNFKKGLEKEKAALEEQKKRHYELGKKIKMGNAGYYERKNHFTTPLPQDNPFRVELKYLKKDKINDLVQGFRNNYSKGFIPNFAAGVKTSRGFFSTQRINRLKDGQAAKDQDGNKVYMNMFSPEDQKKIKGFQATFSKENMAASRQASRDKKNEMKTIDASRQATMLVATNNLRKRVDTKIKQGKEDIRLKYRVEGLKPSGLNNSEDKIRGRVENLLLKESSFLAKEMSGAGNFGANTPSVTRMANAGSVGSAAGSIFETALKAVGKNKLFTKNNASFDIAGFPDEKLQKLFGYYTPFADAKIGLNPDTKRDFNQKLLKLPSSQAQISKEDAAKQQAVSRSSRKQFGPLRKSEGFIPNFAQKQLSNKMMQWLINNGFAKNRAEALLYSRKDYNNLFKITPRKKEGEMSQDNLIAPQKQKSTTIQKSLAEIKRIQKKDYFSKPGLKYQGLESPESPFSIASKKFKKHSGKILGNKMLSTGLGGLVGGAATVAGLTLGAGAPLALTAIPALLGGGAGARYLGYGSHVLYDKFKKQDVDFKQIGAKGSLNKKQAHWFHSQNEALKIQFQEKNRQLMQILSDPSPNLSVEQISRGKRAGAFYHPEIQALEKEMEEIRKQRKELQQRFKKISDNSFSKKITSFKGKFGFKNKRFVNGYIPNFVKGMRGFHKNTQQVRRNEYNRKEVIELERIRQILNFGGHAVIPSVKKTNSSAQPFGQLNEREIDALYLVLRNTGVNNNLAKKVQENYKFPYIGKKGKGEVKRSSDPFLYQGSELRTSKLKRRSDKTEMPDYLLAQGNRSSGIRLFSEGYVPNFFHPLNEAISREVSGLRDRGLPKSSIKIEKSNRLKNPKNPMGLAVTNRFDEPGGLFQGINRSKSIGIDPKNHGAAEGYIPNFIMPALFNALQRGGSAFMTGAKRGGSKFKDYFNQRRVSKEVKMFEKQQAQREKMRQMGMPDELIDQKMSASMQSQGSFGQNLTMGAMFGAPMINEALYGGKELTARQGIMSDAISGAGYGAMLGPKGMAVGAIAGATKGLFGGDERDEINKMVGAISKAKDSLDKKLSNISSMENFGQAVLDLEDAINQADVEAVISANNKIAESIANISNPEIKKEFEAIANSSAPAAEKVQMVTKELENLKLQSENVAAAINTGQKITEQRDKAGPIVNSQSNNKIEAYIGREINFMKAVANQVTGSKSTLVDDFIAFQKQDRDAFLFEPSKAKDIVKDFMPAITRAARIEAKKSTASQISSGEARKDLESDAAKIEELANSFKKANDAFDDFRAGTISRDQRDEIVRDTADVRSDIMGSEFNNTGIKETLKQIYVESGYTEEGLQRLTKQIKGINAAASEFKKFEGQEINKINKERGKNAALNAASAQVDLSNQENSFKDILKIVQQGSIKGSDFEANLRKESGGDEIADIINKQVSSESGETFRAALMGSLAKEVSSTKNSFADLAKAVVTAKETVQKHQSAQEKALALYNKMLDAQQMAANSFRDFSVKISSFEGAFRNQLDFIKSGTDLLASGGSITESQALKRNLQIDQKAIQVQTKIDMSKDLIDLLKGEIKFDKLFNVDKELKRELDIKDKKPTSLKGQIGKIRQDEVDSENSEIAKIMHTFVAQNKDGNYSLQEIKKVISQLQTTGREGNRIAQQAHGVISQYEAQAKMQRDKLIMGQALMAGQLAKQNLQKLGNRVMKTQEHFQGAKLLEGIDLDQITSTVTTAITSGLNYSGGGLFGNSGGQQKKDMKQLGALDDFAAMYGMDTSELLGVPEEDLMFARAMANNAGLEEALKAANGGQLSYDQQQILDKHREKAEESYQTYQASRDLINETSNDFLGGNDLMNIKDPMERMNTQMAQLLSLASGEGIKIQGLTGYSNPPSGYPTEPPEAPNGGDRNEEPTTNGEEILSAINALPEKLSEPLNQFSEKIIEIQESFTTMSDSISSLPELLKTELQSITMEHTVTGNIDFNFNTNVVKEVLGDVVYKELERLLTEPMILDMIGARIKPIIDPQGRLE